MLESMLMGKKALKPPGGEITGVFQKIGDISGMTIITDSRGYAAKGNKVWFGVGGRVNGSYNSRIQCLDLDTLQVSPGGSDISSGPSDRMLRLNDDGSRLWIFGGYLYNSTPSYLSLNTTTQLVAENGGWGSGMDAYSFAHGFRNGKLYLLGVNGTKWCYCIDTSKLGTPSTILPGTLTDTDTYGYVSCQVGTKVYLVGKSTGALMVFDMVTETTTSLLRLGKQVWCDGVYDENGVIYWLVGTDKYGYSSILKYDIDTKKVTTVPITGAIPNRSAYYGDYSKPIWYKGAIYLFRCDLDTVEGKSLYRII